MIPNFLAIVFIIIFIDKYFHSSRRQMQHLWMLLYRVYRPSECFVIYSSASLQMFRCAINTVFDSVVSQMLSGPEW